MIYPLDSKLGKRTLEDGAMERLRKLWSRFGVYKRAHEEACRRADRIAYSKLEEREKDRQIAREKEHSEKSASEELVST